MIKNKWSILTIILFITVIVIGIFSDQESLSLFMSNSYFAISAVLLIIGLFGLILKDGTFDLFHYSMKKAKDKIFKRNNKKTSAKNELPTEEELHTLSRSISNTYTYFLKIGLIFLALSIICLAFYYFFNK